MQKLPPVPTSSDEDTQFVAKADAFLDAIRRPDGSLPPFPDFNRPCRICGKPADHSHYRYDERLQRNVIIEEPEE